jgi:hypothetical protein
MQRVREDSPCPRYHLARQGVVPATQARFLSQSRALCPLHAPRNAAMGRARNSPLTHCMVLGQPLREIGSVIAPS